MQLGFALVEAGQVRRKNSSSIFVKNVYNVIVGVLVYWLIGFGLSYGDVRIFIGNNGDFFATNKLD
jgi:Amt family ammonium transporter